MKDAERPLAGSREAFQEERAAGPDVEKVVGALALEEGLCRAQLTTGTGNSVNGCFVGALLLRAGMRRADVARCNGALIGSGSLERRARAVLWREYGLTDTHLDDVFYWNDGLCRSMNPVERRDYMIQKVREEWGQAAEASPTST